MTKYCGKRPKICEVGYYRIRPSPDFFILVEKDDFKYVLVIEIKADKDSSDENKAKYKYAVEHFHMLNIRLENQGINERYIFHFLSPNDYPIFFDHLMNGTVLEGQEKYRCELEHLLEKDENSN